MADISGTPTSRSVIDSAGSTVDTIFADAIMASLPTLVIDQYNLLMVKEVPDQHDSVTFPVLQNFDLTWTNLSGTGSDLGSEVEVTAAPATTFRKITPLVQSAAIFIHDMVDIQTNKHDFNLYANLAAVNVSKKIDQDGINDGIFNVVQTAGSREIRVAGGYATGSILTGSTLGPDDLSDCKATMSTGSNIYMPDTVLMHPTQYNQLVQSSDFQSQLYRVSGKATFKEGELTKYDGLTIVVTELVNNGATGFGTTEGGYYAVAGHPVAVYSKRVAGCLAKKSSAFRVSTVDSRLKHGKYKIFDIAFTADVLVPEAISILRAADA